MEAFPMHFSVIDKYHSFSRIAVASWRRVLVHHWLFFFVLLHIHFFLFILVEAIAAVNNESNNETEEDNTEEGHVHPANFDFVVHNFDLMHQCLLGREYKWVWEAVEALVWLEGLVCLRQHRVLHFVVVRRDRGAGWVGSRGCGEVAGSLWLFELLI